MTVRINETFNDDWKFLKLTQKDGLSELAIETAALDDSGWERVTLPHTWNDKDGCSGSTETEEGGEHYYRGLGGYRKFFYFSKKKFSGREIFLEFHGANTVTELFVNGRSAGVHEGGYAAFRFDITGLVRLDADNLIAVKVNNAPTGHIAPITDQGDFTKMGGLYRGMNLIAVEKIHFDLMDHGSSGIYITPKNITAENADIGLLIKIANHSAEDSEITVNTKLMDSDGNTAAAGSTVCHIAAGQNAEAKMTVKLPYPVLWNGTENPYLYRAKITLRKNETILDEATQTFGVRTYRIDPDDGFFLNGKHVDLHGVNYHQDSFENGWAMTDVQRKRDYDMMREMGCNTVRMAHYQHDGYEYDLCDQMGIAVWTEIGIVNKMSADETGVFAIADGFVENAGQQLIELIRQNYNHPSIIVWGLSNELYQISDEIYDIYTGLHALAKSEDETRLLTFADNQFWGRFLELPADVVGYNRYFGWYKDAGPAEQFGAWLDSYHGIKEHRPICVSEYGGGAAISQHKDHIDWETEIDPWGERHYENYQSAMHETIWAQFAERRYLWAKYVWCMFDFASCGRREGDTKGQNDKGLATRKREPKDAFYFYRSVWNAAPMLHITEKRFVERPAQVPQVKVYSNAEQVELFVNGVSAGIVYKDSLAPFYSTVFTWEHISLSVDVQNEIKATAYFANGSTLEDTVFWVGGQLFK